MGTDWLHINGTVVSTNDHPATPLYQTYGPDRTQLHKGLTLTALDEGVFICAANSTGNRLLVTLHLPQGPLETPILDQTGRILLNLGDSITVRCDIPKHISPYPTLTWTKDGHTLHTDGHVNTSTPSSWHYRYLSLQLTINNFSPRDRGRYQCAADNGIQHTQSEIIYLDLKGVPALYSAHSTIHYFPGEGEELVMRVRASQYSTLQWAHNSSSITDDRGRHTLEDFGQTMRVSMATLEDSGNYSVYTTREECDGGMTDCKVGVVTIQVIPYGELDCTIAEDNTTLYTGSRLSLSCTVHGYPAPQVTWYHNGTKLHDSHVTSLKGSSVLAVSSVTMETSGMYTCQVEHLNPLTSKPSVKNSTQTVTSE
jgi:hemicentin